MHPQLALLGGLSTWTALAVVATVVGVVVGVAVARRASPSLSAGLLLELAAAVVAGGWLSAKIGHVLLEARGHALPDGGVADGVGDLLRADPWHWARLFEPGFVQFAGLIGAIVTGVVFLHRQGARAALPALADAAVVAVAVGVGIGRLGCFLAGCCYGAPTDLPWAVHFPVGHETHGLGVHPTQLYDAGVALIAVGLWAVVRRRLSPGGPALVVTAVLLMARFATEALRADADRGQLGPLSTSQGLALLGLAVVVVVGVARSRRTPAPAPSPAGPSTTGANPLT